MAPTPRRPVMFRSNDPFEGVLLLCLDRGSWGTMGAAKGVTRDQGSSLASASSGVESREVRTIPRVRVEQDTGMDADWRAQGKCWDMDSAIFFPCDGIGVQAAQRICEECPVKATCLEYALANRIEHGVWGGTSERERGRIRRHRRMAQLQPTHT